MNREQLLESFRRAGPSRRFDGAVERYECYRGDHQLNPDMQPVRHSKRGFFPAAVLVPVVNRDDALTVLLTRRTEHLRHHPGQISFPGGRLEAHDGGPVAAALRETQEEVGLAPERVRVLGLLDDYITRTGFVVTPVVGLIEPPVRLKLDPGEVAEVFEVPLAYLLDESRYERHHRHFQGRERYFYAVPYREYFIWGATAGMLVNLKQQLCKEGPLNDRSHHSLRHQ
ncbi:CoA pyrophosphatase [Motiliproteus sp. SC1-56]|uniref:CoA pyrophosphatase n=1 Tax=Motiliproteus sp. SC1-56 TaxID=2799565 RepID=UPI001A8FE938|nr:CoA pyrophosphatase [Motiliproteus sp. SC1-56]